ncbi:ubiquitin carboxyl-terminal hydrolase [Aureococcus anophagefferens]|uniref:Ubiquitin carboxyl-terminal hydrolase n=1 Tax=Aureococcus anophagefferens TaxID=44056 RepID=A0ABR1FRZ6_AURAN
MISVNVKWGKEVVVAEVAPGDSPAKFMEQLEAKTGVPVARMKLMARGAWRGVLKADMSLAALKEGQNVTLMGTAETLVAPAVATKFLEDMGEAEAAATGLVLPAGFANLGNTCYMNSTLQCLKAVPELRAGLDALAAKRPGAGDVPGALAETYRALDASTKPVEPARFVATLRAAFPQFAQRGRGGGFAQQDAEELYSTLLANLAAALTDAPPRGAANVVDGLFGLELEETLTCAESDAEPPVTRSDVARKLVCNIQGGTAGANVNHLAEGLKLALAGSLDKRSDALGRDATWAKTSRVSKLSPYLCVQFMRFYWKATPDSADHAGVKCKIMRPVSFNLALDVFDFCAPPLQAAIKANRDKYGAKAPDGGGPDGAALLARSGLPPDFQGVYELFAVVTHKGRSADGGHYMGWVKQDGDKWLVFDDDLVSESDAEFVKNLKGGGDEHMSYLQFYRAKSGGN